VKNLKGSPKSIKIKNSYAFGQEQLIQKQIELFELEQTI